MQMEDYDWRHNLAVEIVSSYIELLQSREPPYKYSKMKEYDDWSATKAAANIILERINQGFDPILVVEDYATQMDYFAYMASESGNYETSARFGIGSDVAIDLLETFTDYDIRYEEDIR